LSQVRKKTILKDANKENLYKLLLWSSPELTIDDMGDTTVRMKAMKKLMTRIHPKNFPNNEDALNIYEDIQTFYDACCNDLIDEAEAEKTQQKSILRKRRRTVSPATIIDSIVQFSVRQKWAHLNDYTRPVPPYRLVSGKLLSPLVAYQCINARGAIAHGKRPTLIYSWDNAHTCDGYSVSDVFEKHGGSKSIVDGNTDDIKLELVKNGPVVSVSFIPDKAFYLEHEKNIVQSRIRKHHYCLIIGWELTEFGEVWLVQNYSGDEVMKIGFGTYSIEEHIIFPKDDFITTAWQKGPYFDTNMSQYEGWLQKKSIELSMKTAEFESFMGLLDEQGIYEAIYDKTRFCIRDRKKIAHSRSAMLQDVKWNPEERYWTVRCAFNDSINCISSDE